MSENELDSLMRRADMARKEARGLPRAVDGIWTPWAQVLCFRCHGASGPVTDEAVEANSSLRVGKPETEDDYGEVLCHCDECKVPIWLRSDVGKARRVGEAINGRDDDVTASMWQTGGMCSAVGIIHSRPGSRTSRGDYPLVYISAMDESIFVALFQSDQAYEDWEPDRECDLCWDVDHILVAAIARGLLGVGDDAIAMDIAVEFSDRICGYLSDEEVKAAVEKNRTADPGVCHTQDHCDANMLMSDAFDVVGEDPTPNDETPERERCDRLWGLAWGIAKANEFSL